MDFINGSNIDFEQKVGINDHDKIFFGHSGGGCPKTKNPNLKVEDKANDMELCEGKVDLINGSDIGLEQKVEIADQDKIVFGHSGGGVKHSKVCPHPPRESSEFDEVSRIGKPVFTEELDEGVNSALENKCDFLHVFSVLGSSNRLTRKIK